MASSVFYSPEYSEAVKFYRGFITRIRNLFQNGFPFLTVYLCVACPFFSPILEKPTLPYHVIMGRVTKREPTRKLADVSSESSAAQRFYRDVWHQLAFPCPAKTPGVESERDSSRNDLANTFDVEAVLCAEAGARSHGH